MPRPQRGSVKPAVAGEGGSQPGRGWGRTFHRARPGFPWVTAGTAQEEAKGFRVRPTGNTLTEMLP